MEGTDPDGLRDGLSTIVCRKRESTDTCPPFGIVLSIVLRPWIAIAAPSLTPPLSPLRLPPKFPFIFTMVDPTFPLFPIMAGLGFFLVLIPLPWHLQAWNSGTCYYMMWTALACLNQFVNSIVWSGDAINKAPVWCDICELRTSTFFFHVSLPHAIYSYTNHSCSRVRYSCFCSLHYAQTLQHFTRSFRCNDAC